MKKIFRRYKSMILSAPNYFKALLLCLFSFFFSGAAVAAPILSETVLTANSEGATAGSFDGGTATLTTAANLNVTGHTRNYVAQYFVPSASGSYQIGLSSSTEDTVIVLYTGAFSPTTPGLNATTVRDDYSGSRSPGVTMGTCGTQVSYCPQITENLVGGQTYYIVVTSYRPNRTVSDGVNMYIYGEPVTFGNKSQSDAATGLSSSVQIELTTRARSLINLDKNFINGAINRHVSHQKIVRDDSNTVEYGSTNRHVIEESIFANGDDTNLNGFFRKISPVAENKRLVINTAFSSIANANGNETDTGNLRVALESFGYKEKTFGGALGLQYISSDTVFPVGGSLEIKGTSLTLFHLHSVLPNLVLEGHVTLGLGKGIAELSSGEQRWNSKFDTKTNAFGFSTTGMFDFELPIAKSILGVDKLQIWPTVNVNYARTKASNLRSNFAYGSISESIDVNAAASSVTDLFISPQFRFDLDRSIGFFPGNTVTLAPGLVCQKVSSGTSSTNCGSDFHFYTTNSNSGHKYIELQIQNIDDTENMSGMINFVISSDSEIRRKPSPGQLKLGQNATKDYLKMKNRTYGARSSVSQKKQNKLSFQIKNDQIDNTDAVNERIMEKLPVPRLKMPVNSSDVQFLDGAGNTNISTEDENVAPKTGSVVWYFENLKSSKVHTKNDKIPIGKDPSLTEKALAKAFTFSQNVIQKKRNLKDTTRWSFQNNFNYE